MGAEAEVIDVTDQLRPWQAETAQNMERMNVIVAHRRSGKTVLSVLWLLSKCLERPNMVGAYVCPKRDQAKRIAFEMIKQFSPPGTEFNTSELKITLPNKTRIYMLGTDSDNGDSIRGLGIVAAVLDETADIAPSAWQAVIRPALADHEGHLLAIGTPKGRVGLFWQLYEQAQELPGWHAGFWPVSKTHALPANELAALKREMSDNEYDQELECSFDAAVKGAYYARLLNEAQQEGRIGRVPHEPMCEVILSLDLGMNDATSIWAWQLVDREIRAIWWQEYQNTALPRIVADVRAQGASWNISTWIVPHDVRVRELGSGRTRLSVLQELGCDTVIAPLQSVRDGIEAVRTLIPRIWWDRDGCGDGLEYLKQYRAEYQEQRQVFTLQPRHDFTSHAADSVRYFATTFHEGLIGRAVNRPINYNVSGAI